MEQKSNLVVTAKGAQRSLTEIIASMNVSNPLECFKYDASKIQKRRGG